MTKNLTQKLKDFGKGVLIAASLACAGKAYAKGGAEYTYDKEAANSIVRQVEKTKQDVLATFSYQSNREDENKGKTFLYDILPNGTICQADDPTVTFIPLYIWDVDNDGQFGDAEKEILKNGGKIDMHPEFNDKVKKTLEDIYTGKIKPTSTNTPTPNSTTKIEYYPNNPIKLDLPESENPISLFELNGLHGNTSIANQDYGSIKVITQEDAMKLAKQNQSPTSLESKLTELEESEKSIEPTSNSSYVPSQKKYDWALTAGVNTNIGANGFKEFGVNIGGVWYPADTQDFGIGANVGLSFGPNETLGNYTEVLASGRTASGIIEKTNNISIGLNAELELFKYFILGGGVKFNNYTETVTERLLRNNVQLKQTTNSFAKTGITGNIYAGGKVPITDDFALEVLAGYDWDKSAYATVKAYIPIKSQNEKK